MADDVRVTNWPMGGTSQSIAYELWKYLRGAHDDYPKNVDEELKLFSRCLRAAQGREDYND